VSLFVVAAVFVVVVAAEVVRSATSRVSLAAGSAPPSHEPFQTVGDVRSTNRATASIAFGA